MRKSGEQDRLKDHHVPKWDGISDCGQDTLAEDLNQTLDWDLVTCKRCLEKKEKKP